MTTINRRAAARLLLTLIPSAGAFVSCRRESTQPNPKSIDSHSEAAMRAFEDDWWHFFLQHNPETATQLGEYSYNDQLSQFHPAYFEQLHGTASALKSRLASIDAKALGDQLALDHAILLETLEDQLRGIELKTYLMPVDQFSGVHLLFPLLPTYAPFDSVKHYEDYRARLSALGSRFDQVIESLRGGLTAGLMPPRYLLEKVIPQCRNIAGKPARESDFAEPLHRFPATVAAGDRTRLEKELLAVVDDIVRPAYNRFEHFLQTEYIPHGRPEPGIWSLPDGDERYRFAVHTQTTSDLTPEQIHQTGLAQVADLQRQIEELGHKAGANSGKAFIAKVHSDPALKAKSREQILDNYRRYIAQMEPKLPQLFGLLPKSHVVVKSVPAFMEKESSTQYMNGTPDGSRPGQVWVDTYDPTHHDMLDDEATAYHEGIPGHHMQISIAQELPGLHPFHRALNYNAYVEGWALYAERLGKEVGFYQDPASDLGRLQSELFRAVRLVVDTGVHYKHWTRQQMVDYFTEHFGDGQQTEVDRYIAWPAQALGYKLGQLKILELRDRAQKQLGSKFNIKNFHDQILNAGALPLNLLDTRIDTWLTTQTKNA